jgi:hypothetical protein
MAEIVVSGMKVLVDDEDVDLVTPHTWRVTLDGYVVSSVEGYLHRFILGSRTGQHIHHINGSRLDNRKSNLETSTVSKHSSIHAKTARDAYKQWLESKGLGTGIRAWHKNKKRYCRETGDCRWF